MLIKRFPLVFLNFALIVNGAIIVWSGWHIYEFDNLPTNVVHQHSFWFAAVIFVALIILGLTWIAIIRNLKSYQKTITAKNTERAQIETELRQSARRLNELIEACA